jgi:TP901 family phage tail tape measure protein
MPELGKATYFLAINTAQFTMGLIKAEERARVAGRTISAELNRATAATRRLGASSGVMTRNFGNATKSMERSAAASTAAVRGWGTRVGGTLTTIGARGKGVEKVGRSMSRAFLPLAAALGISAKKALDFEQQMKLIQTQAGGTARDVRILSVQVLNLAKSTAQGPNELARGLFHLKSLGLSNAKAMDVLRQSARGAMTGIADLEKTTSALGGAVRVGIKGTGDYSKAMGTLNGIIGAGNMRMENLIEALGTGVLPTAKLAGLSLTDVGAALTVFTDENMDAAMAMTRFRTALMMMVSPSHQAEKSLATIGLSGKALGLELQKPEGLGKSLALINKHIREHFDLTTKAGRAGAFSVISRAFGGARSANTIMVLLNQAQLYEQKHQQIERSSGKFNEDVASSAKTAANRIKIAWSNVQVAMVLIGRDVVPIIVRITQTISKLATWFSNLPAPVRKVIVSFGLLVVATGPVLLMTGKLMRSLGALGRMLLWFGGASRAGAAAEGITGVGTAAGGAATKVSRLRTMLLGLRGIGVITVIFAASYIGFEFIKAIMGGGKTGTDQQPIVNPAAKGRDRFNYPGRDSSGKALPGYDKYGKPLYPKGRYEYPGGPLKDTKHSFTTVAVEADSLRGKNTPGHVNVYDGGILVGRNLTPKEAAALEKRLKSGKNPPRTGKLGAVAPPITTTIPGTLQLAVAQAKLTKTQADDLKALQAEDRWLRKALHQKGLSLQQRIDITNQIADIDGQIADITSGHKKKKKTVTGSRLIPQSLRTALARDGTTATEADDLKALQAEDRWLRKALKNKKISADRREALLKELAKVDKRIRNMSKDKGGSGSKSSAQAFIEARGTIFSEFAPNVFSPTSQGLQPGSTSGKVINYNQHNTFHEVPKDRHRLARQMHRSVALAG